MDLLLFRDFCDEWLSIDYLKYKLYIHVGEKNRLLQIVFLFIFIESNIYFSYKT